MRRIRDWCISRQLWWGHRIPVFYCDECGQVIVARTDPTQCPKCSSKRLRQDEDILDTWFSSALWPFSTLGWPEKTPDLARFYPTDFLSTAPEIIFLWVARMIFSGLRFMDDVPFSRVYFHSFILVESGQRMSRSKGIGIDPVDMFDKYGTDAVRFTLTYLESQSQSYRLAEKRFEFGRNFTNKLWNAARLLHPFLVCHPPRMNDERRTMNDERKIGTPEAGSVPIFLQAVDKWIISRFNQTLETVTETIEACSYSCAATQLYEFFWHELCDWYLEFAKPRLKAIASGAIASGADDPACAWTLYQVFRGSLQLLHPIMPFITEELWQRFQFGDVGTVVHGRDARATSPSRARFDSIMLSSWPKPIPVDETGVAEVEAMKELIVGVRNVRSQMNVPASVQVNCLINTSDAARRDFLLAQQALICEQAKLAELKPADEKPPHSSVIVLKGLEAYVPLEGLIDFDKEIARIEKEKANLDAEIQRIRQRLDDENFRSKARPEVVEREQERLSEFTDRLARLTGPGNPLNR
jgi:valyl-tRNA synthetase